MAPDQWNKPAESEVKKLERSAADFLILMQQPDLLKQAYRRRILEHVVSNWPEASSGTFQVLAHVIGVAALHAHHQVVEWWKDSHAIDIPFSMETHLLPPGSTPSFSTGEANDREMVGKRLEVMGNQPDSIGVPPEWVEEFEEPVHPVIRVGLPPDWLLDVWLNDLAVVDGNLILNAEKRDPDQDRAFKVRLLTWLTPRKGYPLPRIAEGKILVKAGIPALQVERMVT